MSSLSETDVNKSLYSYGVDSTAALTLADREGKAVSISSAQSTIIPFLIFKDKFGPDANSWLIFSQESNIWPKY